MKKNSPAPVPVMPAASPKPMDTIAVTASPPTVPRMAARLVRVAPFGQEDRGDGHDTSRGDSEWQRRHPIEQGRHEQLDDDDDGSI